VHERRKGQEDELFVTAFIVPTGIQASVGGYLGDATPFANRIAALSNFTITNPNVVNGGVLNLMAGNILYTEGTVMDMLFRGETALKPHGEKNRIGVVIEKTKDRGALALIHNTISAMRAVGGVEVVGAEQTEGRIGARAYIKGGVAHGDIRDLSPLDETIKTLIKTGAQTIALSAEIRADKKLWETYFRGGGPNPVGAIEAVISHYVVDKYRIPAAHAPLVRKRDWPMNLRDTRVFWRAGAEAISPAYLGCVLLGLSRAPYLCRPLEKGAIGVDDISALVMPYSSCGGIPVFECADRGIPIIAVKEIRTNLNVTPRSIGIDAITADTMDDAIRLLSRIKRR